VAFALNFDTPGEKLTSSAAGNKYLAIPLEQYRMINDPITPADMICRELERWNFGAADSAVLNIAGNGIYTLRREGLKQEDVDDFLFDVMAALCGRGFEGGVRTGGQTGVDIAGAAAAVACGVYRVDVVMSRGWLQRGEDGKDVAMSGRIIRGQIESSAARLLGEAYDAGTFVEGGYV
jgi:hypothetical protein